MAKEVGYEFQVIYEMKKTKSKYVKRELTPEEKQTLEEAREPGDPFITKIADLVEEEETKDIVLKYYIPDISYLKFRQALTPTGKVSKTQFTIMDEGHEYTVKGSYNKFKEYKNKLKEVRKIGYE